MFSTKVSIMVVYNLTIKHFRIRQLSILFSLFMITNFFSVLTPFTFASALSFNFPSFSFSDPNISYEQDAYADEHQVIQLTGNEEWRVGRATYFRPMHLWDKNSKKLTDFASHFSFVIDSQNQPYYADGMAFFLAPNDFETTIATKGGSLGLFDPNSSNRFVAVEFDICFNAWDPLEVHEGTQSYMDPRCVTTRKASKESYIYSFGIVALELACGRKPVILEAPEDQVVVLEWVQELHGRGEVLNAADQRLGGNFDEQQMKCLLNVGLWCAHFEYDCRPSIREVIQVLNFEAPLPLLQLDTPRSL